MNGKKVMEEKDNLKWKAGAEGSGHPLASFRYCPRCGGRSFVVYDDRAKRCEGCGFTYYMNSAASVVAVVVNGKGELLLSRRAYEPARGCLDLPGGFVNLDESLEDAVKREFKEETGGDVEIVRWLFSLPNRYVYSGLSIATTDSFFLCRLRDGAGLRAGDDVAELLWIGLDEIDTKKIGLSSIRKGVEMLVADRKLVRM